MIRVATLQDIPALFALGRRVHSRSGYSEIAMDEIAVRTNLAEMISSPRGIVLVDEVNGALSGIVAGFYSELWWSKRKYAIPLIAYAERKGAIFWMVRRFVKWALEQKGAAFVVLDVSFGGDLGSKTEKIYERLGAERVGGSYTVRKVK